MKQLKSSNAAGKVSAWFGKLRATTRMTSSHTVFAASLCCITLFTCSAASAQQRPAEQTPAQNDFPDFEDLINGPGLSPIVPGKAGGTDAGSFRIPERDNRSNFLPGSGGASGLKGSSGFGGSGFGGSGVSGSGVRSQFPPGQSPDQRSLDSRQNRSNKLPASGFDESLRFNQGQPIFDPINGQLLNNPDQNMGIVDEPRVIIDKGFDWSSQVTSVADLRFESSTSFLHGDAFLTPDEETAYIDLINAIAEQRRLLLQQAVDELDSNSRQVAKWEEAFYQFANARRLAWNNGHLRQREIPSELNTDLPDPFRDAAQPTMTDQQTADAPFVMLDDIARFPEDYVGRPVVLYGTFKASRTERLADELRPEATYSSQYIPQANRPQIQLLRGTLTSLKTGQPIAEVDTQGLMTPQSGTVGMSDWPSDSAIPVIVKGWVVKKWGTQPLIYCETLRQISPNPHRDMIRTNTADKRSIRDEEKWLYYETMKQLELIRPAVHKEIADLTLRQRIEQLMRQVQAKAEADFAALSGKLKAGSISESEYRTRKTSLQRQLGQRIARYRTYLKQPEDFQTYVDMFQYPDVWHGYLVTLHGHVRHVVSYPGDEMLYGGRMLHELWLYTDDSQHNPAVIVTANLPKDFPTEADVIDRVKVTGCCFKRYVYSSQDTDRIAPLILAGEIEWSPTIDQIQSLVADGHLAASAPLVARAAAMSGKEIGRTATFMICVFVVLVIMILWGRAQREERDRVRLRKRVNEVPEFENPELPDYPVALSDFGSDYSRDYRLS